MAKCETCKYRSYSNYEEPCSSCIHSLNDGSKNKWEPKEIKKNCDNCRHVGCNLSTGEPCRFCNRLSFSEWEPKEAEVKKHVDCLFDGDTTSTSPCRNCNNRSNWKPKETEIILEKENDMRTQEIFAVVVTETVKIKDDLGQIESIKRRVIYSAIDIPAFDKNNAKAKALIAANKVTGAKAIKDLDEVEVEVSCPFQAS